MTCVTGGTLLHTEAEVSPNASWDHPFDSYREGKITLKYFLIILKIIFVAFWEQKMQQYINYQFKKKTSHLVRLSIIPVHLNLSKIKFPKLVKKQLFFAHVHSRIQYSIEVYGHACSRNLKQIHTMQNKIQTNLYTPTLQLHKNLKLLKVSDVFKMRIVQTVYKSLNHMLPDIFNNYFQK